jgi:Protein of unknown function (DUF1573)
MRIQYILFIFLFLASCTAGNRKVSSKDIDNNAATPENPAPTGPVGTPVFETTIHNFGKIIDGEQVQHKFKFKNTGKGDLTLAKVEAHCGCTTPEWTRDIIPPGGEGFILATFNSSGRGEKDGVDTEKGITVEFANSTVKSIELTLKSTIYKKD